MPMPCSPVCAVASTWVSLHLGLGRWSAASSRFETCCLRDTTILTRNARGHSWIRFCTITPCCCPWRLICWLTNGDLNGSPSRSMRWTGWVHRGAGWRSSTPNCGWLCPAPARSPSAVSVAVPGSFCGAVPLSTDADPDRAPVGYPADNSAALARRQELRERQPRPAVRQPRSRAQRYHLRRAVLPGPPGAAAAARAAADVLPVAATHRAVRQAHRRQPGVR